MNTYTHQTSRMQPTTLNVIGAAALLACAGLASAQVTPVLLFEHAGLGTMLQDDKDAGFLRAFSMLPERLSELPNEIEGMDRQIGGLLKLAATTIHRPTRFALVSNEDDQSDGGMGYGLVVSIDTANQGDAEQLDGLMQMALAEADMPYEPKPSRQYDGQSEIATPVAMLRFGPASTNDAWRYQITAGSIGDVPDIFKGNLNSTPGFEPVMRLRMDPAGLEAALTMAENSVPQDEQQAHDIFSSIREMGLTGADGPKLDSVMGYTKTHAVSRTVITNFKKFADDMGVSTEKLSARDIAILPKDIVFGSVGRGSFDQLIDMAEQMSQNGLPVNEFLDEFEDQLGINLFDDIIIPLGDVTAMYASDTTGGGGLTSMVMVVGLDDADRLSSSLTKLGSRANMELANEEPDVAKYVSFDRWKHDGHTMLTVHAKGLPIPVEPTIAISDKWMVIGMTPSATVAAMEQASGKNRSSILDNQHVKRASVDGSIKFAFMDTERMASSGYGSTNLFATALASAVRSPGNGMRDAGLIMPTFNTFIDNVKPSISTTQWDGNDLVMRTTSDRSMVVNAAAMGGVLHEYVMPIVGAIVVPAMMNEWQSGGMDRWGMNNQWDAPIPERALLEPVAMFEGDVADAISAAETAACEDAAKAAECEAASSCEKTKEKH